MLDAELLRSLVAWHLEYRPDLDDSPGEYVERGIVGWGRSRRLGLLKVGRLKAYIGVQHVDPSRTGWDIVDTPDTRFFVSVFVDGHVVTLRTFPTMGACLVFIRSTMDRLPL